VALSDEQTKERFHLGASTYDGYERKSKSIPLPLPVATETEM